jgi:SSS family solute:Na+ symporter
MHPSAATLAVFLALFGLVSVLGFAGERWRRGDLSLLHEWALAGRRFGTFVSWFLIGGDLYTAYTFIAVPALVYGQGPLGFFALPYTALVYPLVFVFGPRLWTVARRRGYITYADFIRERYDSRSLELAVAATGILATMPYIALQLVGMQVVIASLGFPTTGPLRDLPIVVAFAILAAYTYRGGLRAPALVAIVKDVLIYATVIAAVIVIPAHLGGWGRVFAAAGQALAKRPHPIGLVLAPGDFTAYATLALGSALALFMYPHSLTGLLGASGTGVIRRNMVLLPAYSLLLALIAAFGYLALAAGLAPANPNAVVPQLLATEFTPWFTGVGFAAIVIGALVPAAIMSIAAANLWTRTIYREYLKPGCTPAQECAQAKLASLVVKLGALLFVIGLPTEYAINFQLFAGGWILQTLPAIVGGLYTRWFHRRALFAGWLVGMAAATYMPAVTGFRAVYPLHIGVHVVPGFAALYAFALNLAVAAALTPVFDRTGARRGTDRTTPADYEEEPAGAAPLPAASGAGA